MAIILNKNKDKTRAIIPSFEEHKGLCRESTIVVKNDGSIQIKGPDGSILPNGILNLGYQGDNNVTLINIDTSELNWGQLDDNNNINLKDAYLPILIFRDKNDPTDIHSIEFEGNYFVVPSSITDKATTYEIIFTLQERLVKQEGGAE